VRERVRDETAQFPNVKVIDHANNKSEQLEQQKQEFSPKTGGFQVAVALFGAERGLIAGG